MRRADKPIFVGITDSREQRPFILGPPRRRELEDGGQLCYALDAGDYSAELHFDNKWLLLPIRLERKSIPDLFGVIGRQRERFVRELEKLSKYRSYIVIEGTAEEVKRGYERSLVSGEAAFASLACWSCTYGVQPIFAGNRVTGAAFTQRVLEEFAIHYLNNNKQQ
jgi:ERCC4-type nuclease